MSNKHLYDHAKKNLSDKEREVLDELVAKAEFLQLGLKTTICLLTCENGCEIVGYSHVIEPEQYDIEIGARYALKRATDSLMQVWAYGEHWEKTPTPEEYQEQLNNNE